MASRNEAPKVNAGSMADIAFLLLIFFLVTTSIQTDAGLDRMLPRENTGPPPPIPQRNIFPILINGSDELLVDNERIDIKNLQEMTIQFLDNGGATLEASGYCDYCKGGRDTKSSDNPDKAIVSLLSNRETSYGTYITVQNELVGAYNYLRNREGQRLYSMDYTVMEALYLNPETPLKEKKELKKKLRRIQNLFPMRLSEAERN